MSECDAAWRARALHVLERVTAGDADAVAPDATAWAAHPVGEVNAAGLAGLHAELRRALPDLERRDDILLAGPNAPDARWIGSRPSPMVATTGCYLGTFREPFLGIPPTGGVVALTYGEAHHVEGGRLRRSWLFWDIAGLMMRAGCWPLGPTTGTPLLWPGPKGGGGLRLAPSPEAGSLDRVLEMHEGLNTFHGPDIAAIDMRHWAEGFMYWAGGAIGACRGIDGFRAHHQIPYRRAFPGAKGAGHFVRVSDGPFAVTGGDVAVTHSGADYWGVGATGRQMRFRVMDFYRFDGAGLIAENWLPNDTLGLLDQMGVDVMARMHHVTGRPRRTL